MAEQVVPTTKWLREGFGRYVPPGEPLGRGVRPVTAG